MVLVLLPAMASARIVINEVFYHAPNDLEDLEYIEVHNTGDQPVDLSGWAFTKGIKFKFAPSTRIEAKGFLVLCRNSERFKQYYDVPIAGVFKEPLSNKGERLALADPSGQVVDAFKFQDSAPWPIGADGCSGSLERISPDASSDNPSNWASSPLSEDRLKPAGTPGKVNATFSSNLPPVISNVSYTPENPLPDQPVKIEADVLDANGVAEVHLLYRLAGPGFEKPESTLPMKKISQHRYAAAIPGQAKDQLIRFRIQAASTSGARRFFPAETEPRPAFSCYIHEAIEPAKIPFGWIIDTTEVEFRAAQQRARAPGRGEFNRFFNPEEMDQGRARSVLEGALDLQSAWFELTLNQPADLGFVQQLKLVFTAKLSERNKLIDDVLESPNLEEKLRAIPDIVKTFQSSLAESLKPLLTDAQNRAFTQWLEQQRQPETRMAGMVFGNPGTVVKSWIKLEGAWNAVSMKAEIDENRFGDLRKSFQEVLKERNELVAQVAGLRQLDEKFRELRERGETLDHSVAAKLKPVLSPAQNKQLEDWQNSRNTLGGEPRGFGGPPGGFRGGPGAFGGPPDGFRGGPGPFGGGRGGFRSGPVRAASSRSAFVYCDPMASRIELFDFIQVAPRSGGQKVHLYKDRPLDKMTTLNLIFENESAVLAEPLAYEVYRRAGIAAEQSYHIRLWLNGQPIGYHLLVEQPNSAFLRRNKIRDDGNLYKILWYERGVVGQHEKKTDVRGGHDDILALVDALEKTEGDAQWELIKKRFDVEQVVNYFAVNMVLSHWDGFFNNYLTYHDVRGTGKWTMYPWDQDNTWGLVGMMGRSQAFYTMPITFGMKGDVLPGEGGAPGPMRGFRGGGAMWWRAPGYFSGPLLANAQFRKLFLARTKEILETVYTEEVFIPTINAMGERLKPEVVYRAELMKSDPGRATQNFEHNLEGLREHLRKRREFLLAQEEVKKAGKFSTSGLRALTHPN